jgi:Protein of unknown function, DUF488
MQRSITLVPMTSSWFVQLPETHARIGISRGRPRGQSGFRVYSALAPGEWWNRVSIAEFRDLYMEQLSRLDPQAVLSDLHALARDRVPTLLCFEKPDDDEAGCHRGYVAAWLKDVLDLDVLEFGVESMQCWWAHPKIPREFRIARHVEIIHGKGAERDD